MVALDAILLTSVLNSNGTLQLGLLLEVPEGNAEADEGQDEQCRGGQRRDVGDDQGKAKAHEVEAPHVAGHHELEQDGEAEEAHHATGGRQARGQPLGDGVDHGGAHGGATDEEQGDDDAEDEAEQHMDR